MDRDHWNGFIRTRIRVNTAIKTAIKINQSLFRFLRFKNFRISENI